MGGECEVSYEILAENILHEDFSVRLAAVRKLKHLIIGNRRHKSELIGLGVVPRLVSVLGEPEVSQELLCETVTVLGSFAHGTKTSVEAVVSAEAVPFLTRGLLHPSLQVVLCCLRTLSTLYSFHFHSLDSDLIFRDAQVVTRLVALLAEPHPLGQRAALLLAKACQTQDHQSVLCEQGALRQLAKNILSTIQKLVAASLLCISSIVYENSSAANLIAKVECEGEPLVCVAMRLLSTSQDKNIKMAAAKCLSFLHRCRGVGGSQTEGGMADSFRSRAVAMDTPQISSAEGGVAESQSGYGMDNFHSGVSLKVLPTLARLTRQDGDISLRTEAISTLAYLTEAELPLQELAATSEKLVPCVIGYLTTPPPDSESEVVLPDHLLLWQRLRGACLMLLSSLASSREELRCKVSGQKGVVDQLARALQDRCAELRVAALRCLLSLSRSTKLLRTCLYDHTCWRHVVDMLMPESTYSPDGHTHIPCLRGATAVACNLLLPFSPCREAMLEVGVVPILANLVNHEDENIRVNSVWALMSAADSSSSEIRGQIVTSLTSHRLLSFLSPATPPVLLQKALGLLVNLTQGHESISYIGDNLLSQQDFAFLSALGDLMEGAELALGNLTEGAGIKEQLEQCLCVLVNLSGGGSRIKDALTGDEKLVKILCSVLRTSDCVSVVMATVDIVRNLAAVECEGHVHRQNCLKEFGANTALQKLEIKFEHKRLQLHIQDALEQFSA